MVALFPIYPDLRDKVALITGVGQVGDHDPSIWGNGAAAARTLAHNAAKIFGCDLSLVAAEFTIQRLHLEVPDLVSNVMAADMAKLEDVERVIEAVVTKHGRIDILHNKVGMTMPGDPATISEDTWQKQIDLNLNSVFGCCKLVLPIMEKRGAGAIVKNASITALRYIGKTSDRLCHGKGCGHLV